MFDHPPVATFLFIAGLVFGIRAWIMFIMTRRTRRLQAPKPVDLILQFTHCRFDKRVDHYDAVEDIVLAQGVILEPGRPRDRDPMLRPMMPFYIDANGQHIRMRITQVNIEYRNPDVIEWHAQDEASLIKWNTWTPDGVE